MASADIDVCNLALLRIGQRQLITSLNTATDTSQPAAICAQLYAQHRDTLLKRYAWRFATEQAALAVATLVQVSTVIPGWQYQYVLPADFLEAQYVFSGARPGSAAASIIGNTGITGVTQISLLPAINGVAPNVPFEVLGGYLFTDWINAQLVYTGQITNVALFPPEFVDALAWRIAVDLALSLSTKPEVAAKAQQAADVAFQRAVTSELNAREPDIRPDSQFVMIRG